LPGIAQDKYVVSANIALNAKNFDEAKSEIDKAMASPETKEKPKALFAKAQIYAAMENVDKYKKDAPYREAAKTLFHLIEVKPDYEKSTVDQLLLFCGFLSYNDGVKAYNEKKYTESADLMRNVVHIYELGGGKRFDKMPVNMQRQFDTVAADANVTLANSAYYGGNMEEAIPLLIKVKNNPIRKQPAVYECLIDAYNRQKNTAQAFATIEEAIKIFPEDATLRNYELNYYIQNGTMDELTKKLEDAEKKEPNNADIVYNLATTYLSMAAPRDGKRPANAAEMLAKSEGAFTRLVKIDPNNPGYNTNFGVLYFNQATDYNDQINAITGSSAADQKKYEELKAKRDALFAKSTPYFEKAYAEFSPDEAKLKGEDLKAYKSVLQALNKVYAMQNKLDKSVEMKAKLDALKG
jgi:tetratricopeptide (TPR) repeat protein